MPKINWTSFPLDEMSKLASRRYDPSYENVLTPTKDMTDRFQDEMELRANSNQNMLVSVFGSQGSGKSLATIDILSDFAEYRGRKFKASNIFFTPTDTLQFVETCEKGEIVLNDEQPFTAGLGSGIERMALDNVEMTVRQHGLCFGFVAPRLIDHVYHYAFETWDWGSDEKIDWKNFDWKKDWTKKWKYTRLIAYNWKLQKLGFIVTQKPDDAGLLEEYETRKSKFIDDIRGMRGGKRHEFLVRMAFKTIGVDVDENNRIIGGEINEKYITDFVRTKSKSLRQLHTRIALHGKMIGSEELKQLTEYVEYVIETTPELRKMALDILLSTGSSVLSVYDEAKMMLKKREE